MRDWRQLIYPPLTASMILSYTIFWASTASLKVAASINGVWLPTASDVIFWVTVTLIVLALPLRRVLTIAVEGLRRNHYLVLVPSIYFVIHLFVYGLLLERLLVQAFGVSGLPPNGFGAFVSYSYFYSPHTALSALLTLTVQPSLNITVPAYYSLALGPFAVTMAIIITLLVTASTYQLTLIAPSLRRVGESIGIPVLGLAGGASCCLSIPILLEYFSPVAQAFAVTQSGSLTISILYYALPLSVALALKLAVDGLNKTCVVIRVAHQSGLEEQ